MQTYYPIKNFVSHIGFLFFHLHLQRILARAQCKYYVNIKSSSKEGSFAVYHFQE